MNSGSQVFGILAALLLAGVLGYLIVQGIKKYFPSIYYCSWQGKHHWVWKRVKGACLEKSYCTYCKAAGEERPSHHWDWIKVEGACLEKQICLICKLEGSARPIDHELGDWEKVEGECLERKVCANCHEIIEERVSHTWGDWEKVDGYELERKICVHCHEMGSERTFSQKAFCTACNGSGKVLLMGSSSFSTCGICGGSGVVKKYSEKNWGQDTPSQA